MKTRIEHWQARCTLTPPPAVGVSNRAAMGAKALTSVDIVRSHRANTSFTAICVFPMPRLNREERILMEALAAEMEMIYTVFASRADTKNKLEDTQAAN